MLPDYLLSSVWCYTALKVLKETEVTGLSGQTELLQPGPYGAWKQAWAPPLGEPVIKIVLLFRQSWGLISLPATLISIEPSDTQADIGNPSEETTVQERDGLVLWPCEPRG